MRSNFSTDILVHSLLSLLVMTSCLAPVTLRAQTTAAQSLQDLSPEERAVFLKYLAEARDMVAADNHADAIDYLLRAQAIFPHPKIPVRLAESYEALGDYASAATIYERLSKDAPTAEERTEASARLAALAPKLGPTQEEKEEDATQLALASARAVVSGAERFAATLPEPDEPESITPPVIEEPTPHKKIPAASWLMAGGSVLAGAAAGGFIYMRVNTQAELDDALSSAPTKARPDGLEELAAREARQGTLAVASSVLSGALLTGALLTWALSSPARPDETSARTLHIWLDPRRAGITWRHDF